MVKESSFLSNTIKIIIFTGNISKGRFHIACIEESIMNIISLFLSTQGHHYESSFILW